MRDDSAKQQRPVPGPVVDQFVIVHIPLREPRALLI